MEPATADILVRSIEVRSEPVDEDTAKTMDYVEATEKRGVHDQRCRTQPMDPAGLALPDGRSRQHAVYYRAP